MKNKYKPSRFLEHEAAMPDKWFQTFRNIVVLSYSRPQGNYTLQDASITLLRNVGSPIETSSYPTN
jgi:hypothetical protein